MSWLVGLAAWCVVSWGVGLAIFLRNRTPPATLQERSSDIVDLLIALALATLLAIPACMLSLVYKCILKPSAFRSQRDSNEV